MEVLKSVRALVDMKHQTRGRIIAHTVGSARRATLSWWGRLGGAKRLRTPRAWLRGSISLVAGSEVAPGPVAVRVLVSWECFGFVDDDRRKRGEAAGRR